MKNQISVSIEDLNVLRKTLKQAEDIISRLGDQFGSLASESKAPKPEPKRTKLQKINDYKKLIESRERVKKPEYLKK